MAHFLNLPLLECLPMTDRQTIPAGAIGNELASRRTAPQREPVTVDFLAEQARKRAGYEARRDARRGSGCLNTGPRAHSRRRLSSAVVAAGCVMVVNSGCRSRLFPDRPRRPLVVSFAFPVPSVFRPGLSTPSFLVASFRRLLVYFFHPYFSRFPLVL